MFKIHKDIPSPNPSPQGGGETKTIALSAKEFMIMKHLLSFVFLLIFLSGCARQGPPPPSSLSEANRHLQTICDKDLTLSCRLFPVGDTLWVYVPVEFRFIDLMAVRGAQPKNPAAEKTVMLEYLDGYFKDREFVIFYDVRDKVRYPEHPGYQNKYTDEFTAVRQAVMSAVFRAYGGYDGTQAQKAPSFVVIVLADIRRGLETRMILALEDLVRGMTDAGFYEEFAKRVVNKPLAGNMAMVDDKNGRSIRPVDLSWAEFLTEQILYRVNFQYQQSETPPADAEAAILGETAAVLGAYGFKDFEAVRVKDLQSGGQKTVGKNELFR